MSIIALAAGKYDHIDFKPPKSVADAARRGLEVRRKAKPSSRGGLTTGQAAKAGVGSGVQRAVNLANRNNLSPATVRRMLRFFQRHQKSAKIDAGKTQYTDKGWQAWQIWGGNPGYAWARKVVKQMDAADRKAKQASSPVLQLTKLAATLSHSNPRLAAQIEGIVTDLLDANI